VGGEKKGGGTRADKRKKKGIKGGKPKPGLKHTKKKQSTRKQEKTWNDDCCFPTVGDGSKGKKVDEGTKITRSSKDRKTTHLNGTSPKEIEARV